MTRSSVPVTARAASPSRQPGVVYLASLLLAAALLLLPITVTAQNAEVSPGAEPQAEYKCFYPTADTYANKASPSTNYGGDSTVVIQHTDANTTVKTAYLRFDLSAIPSGSNINSATLKLYLTQASVSATYHLGRITSPWQEFNLTWNNAPSIAGIYDSPTHSGTSGWKTWNATQPVSDWVNGTFTNYGLVVHTGLLESPSPFGSLEGGIARAPQLCVEWSTGGAVTDLVFTGLEVTQAVQDLDNSVRLVAGKRTFVRLHARSTVGAWRTFASLAITCDGFGRVIYPINPGTAGYIVIGESPDRGSSFESFLFELPSDCTDEPEQIALFGQVNPSTYGWRGSYPLETSYSNNVSGQYFIDFETAPQLDTIVYLADYEYDTGAGTSSVSTSTTDAYMLRSWLKRAYPIPDAWMTIRRIDFGETSVDEDDRFTYPTSGDFNEKLAAKREWDLGRSNWYESELGSNERHIRYVGMIADVGGFMRGSAPVPGNVASGPTGTDHWGWDFDGSYGDWYGGHEIGHSLGRSHVACNGDEDGPDSGYPHTGGLISTAQTGDTAFFGFDSGDLADGVYDPGWSDVMSYCAFQWISDYTTHAILDYMQTNFTSASSASPVVGSHLLVVGTIDVAAGTADLEPLFVLDDLLAVEPPQPGPYNIVLYGSAGAELARYAFTPAAADPGPPAPGELDFEPARMLISEMVPFVGGTDRVVIEGPTGVLAQVSAGPAAPSITVLAPNGGETLSGDHVTVSWTASDGDGDALSFSVEYSPDDGATWELVAYGLTGSSFAVPRANLLSTSAQGRFRVSASDGIHTTSDISNSAFTITTRAPELIVVSPEDGAVIASGQTLNLQAIAYSADTGILDGDQPRWVSNLGGLLATGSEATVTGLGEGTHTIVVIANDGKRTASTSLQVTVVANPSLLPEPVDELQVGPGQVAVHPLLGVTSGQVSIGNASGSKSLNWQAFENTGWLSLDKTSGSTPDQATISVDVTGLGPGSYSANVVFLTPDIPGGSSEVVRVGFILPPEPERVFLPLVFRR